jgi:hypothetical protein
LGVQQPHRLVHSAGGFRRLRSSHRESGLAAVTLKSRSPSTLEDQEPANNTPRVRHAGGRCRHLASGTRFDKSKNRWHAVNNEANDVHDHVDAGPFSQHRGSTADLHELSRELQMTVERRTPLPTPKTVAAYVAKNAEKVKKAQTQKHKGMESVRVAEYQGHHIVVRTRYEIEVDGKMLMGHVGVTNDGNVHYHPVPNLSFASAVEMVEKLIDIFPEDFGASGPHGNHGTGHDHKTAKVKKAAKKTPR